MHIQNTLIAMISISSALGKKAHDRRMRQLFGQLLIIFSVFRALDRTNTNWSPVGIILISAAASS